MTAEQFTYWLQGYAELNETAPTAEQWQSIRDHLALVFTKVTPAIPTPGRDRIVWAVPQVQPWIAETPPRHLETKVIC